MRVLGDFAVPFDYPRSPRLRFDEGFASNVPDRTLYTNEFMDPSIGVSP